MHRRVYAIATHYGVSAGELKEGGLSLLTRVGLDNVLVEYDGPYDAGSPAQFHSQLMNLTMQTGSKIIVLDSLHDFFAGNENVRLQARKFISLTREIATEAQGAVIFTSHPSMAGRAAGTGESGNTAWGAAVRSRLYLRSPKEQSGAEGAAYRHELEISKNNYGKTGDVFKLRWKDGVFLREGQPGSLEGGIAKRACESVFLDLLAQFTAVGRHVSESRQATNYAAKAFANHPNSDGYTKSDFQKAMERLFAAGKIRVEEYGRSGDHRRRIVATGEEAVPFEV